MNRECHTQGWGSQGVGMGQSTGRQCLRAGMAAQPCSPGAKTRESLLGYKAAPAAAISWNLAAGSVLALKVIVVHAITVHAARGRAEQGAGGSAWASTHQIACCSRHMAIQRTPQAAVRAAVPASPLHTHLRRGLFWLSFSLIMAQASWMAAYEPAGSPPRPQVGRQRLQHAKRAGGLVAGKLRHRRHQGARCSSVEQCWSRQGAAV
jgi:hypothetical protein